MQNYNQVSNQNQYADLLGILANIMRGAPSMNNENNHPVINTPSNAVEKSEMTSGPATHEVNTLGSQFADVHAALQWVSHEANNPVKNRWSEEERFAWSDLPELYRMIKPLMYQAGLFHSQTMKTNADGVPEIITTFRHIPTGSIHVEKLETTSTDIEKQLKKSAKNLDEHQRWGWTMTYCRRYALYAALGLQPDDNGDLDAMSRRGRRPSQQKPPASRILGDCLPDVGHPDWEEAERRAVALGAVPYTPEEIERAKELKRCYPAMTLEQAQFIDSVTVPMNGNLSDILPLYKKYEAELFDRIRNHEDVPFDEVDQRRAVYMCWLRAAEEYSGRKCPGETEDTNSAPAVDDTAASVASFDEMATEELEKLQAKREARRAAIAAGGADNTTGTDEDDAAADELFHQVKSGLSPQPPFPDAPEVEPESRQPRNLTDEHAALTRHKVRLCRDIADGDDSTEDKKRLINMILSRTDFNAAAEIRQILEGLTSTGAPSSTVIGIGEDDIPY